MLCGILEPSEGDGWVLGIDLRHEPERVKSAIGYMSQRFSLYDDLTVDENLAFYSRVYEVPRAERAARILQMMRLADLVGRERQLAGHLSGGYRQRLALSCALVHQPRLIFLDEPTAGVDPVSRRTFWALIRRRADARGAGRQPARAGRQRTVGARGGAVRRGPLRVVRGQGAEGARARAATRPCLQLIHVESPRRHHHQGVHPAPARRARAHPR